MNWAEELVGKMSEMHESGKVVEELSRSRKGELFVLRYLYNKNAAATPSELSEALDSSTARISAALKSLEKKGQIKREIDKSNRRFILVTLTVAGREYIRIRLNQMKEHMTQVL